jgi:hypothetical protein
LALCAVVLAALVRSLTAGIAATILFLGGYLGGVALGLNGLMIGTAVVSTVVAIGIGAFVITACRSRLLWIVPILAYAAAALLYRDLLTALLVLIPFPAMGLLAYCTMNNRSRVWAICLTSLFYGLCLLFGLALLQYRAGGTMSADELFRALDALRNQAIEAMLANEQYTALLAEQYKNADIPIRTLVTSLVEFVFNVLPAICIVAVNLMAYTAQLICVHTYTTTGLHALVTKTSRLFVLSVLSALLYLVCCFIAILPTEMTLFGAAICNLLIILMPGMMLVGVYKLVGDIRYGRSKVWLFILIGCAVFAPYMLIFGISLSGAMTTLTRPLITRILLKQGNHPSGSDDSHPQ